MVIVKDSTPTDNVLYDEVLAELNRSVKNRTLNYWIPKLLRTTRPLLKRVGDNLQEKGLVRREDKKLLRIFPITKFYVTQPDIRQGFVSEMVEALVLVREPDWEMNMLISLYMPAVCSSGILKEMSAEKCPEGLVQWLRRI